MAVFFSFHYNRDHWRVQQVINMGAIEGQPILNPQAWEEVKRKGDQAVENWIDKHMAYKSAVVVLVGAETADRRWVRYEIVKAWNDRRRLVGIRIHGLADQNRRTDLAGPNPFAQISLPDGRTLASFVTLHAPAGSDSQAVYADIQTNLTTWIDNGYKRS